MCYALPQLRRHTIRFFGNDEYETCGTSALATLTGLTPKFLNKCRPKSSLHWTDRSIQSFLSKRNFHLQQVTKYSVTHLSPNGVEFERMPINPLHVLLCNSLCCKNEASWFIVHAGIMFHNFEQFELNPLFFVNKPTQSVWIVKHPKWDLTNLPKPV